MGAWRRLIGRLGFLVAVFVTAYLGGTLGWLGTREVRASHNFVDFLVDNGITAGCQLAPPLYCGAQPVTRGQMAVFLKKLADLSCIRREGNDVIFEGCNVHVRSGAGATDAPVNGLGNLIVGYNESSSGPPENRTGSHNLVVGPWHTYSSYGGFVAGRNNAVTGPSASVSGGFTNTASSDFASVSGGISNTASGDFASVSGGSANTATGSRASVSGGSANTATGSRASVSGGSNRAATAAYDWVAGGLFQNF
jgi:hypothetical protein